MTHYQRLSTLLFASALAPSIAYSAVCTPEHASMGHCELTPPQTLPVSDGSAAEHIPMPFPGRMHMADDPFVSKISVDRLEQRRNSDNEPSSQLEANAWFGYDLRKLRLKVDLEYDDGEPEEAQVQALYSQAFSPYWDFNLGWRHTQEPEQRDWLAVGVQGLAPYFIETQTTLFFTNNEQAEIRFQAEQEWMLTQKTYLLPELELSVFGRNEPEKSVGAGLASTRMSLRLVHNIRRKLSVYAGLSRARKWGNTAKYAQEAGTSKQESQLSAGIRFWL